MNSTLIANQAIGQRKAFGWENIPESTFAGKENVNIDIFISSRNCDRKVMQLIRITSGPSTITKVKTVPLGQMNIYQSNINRKNLIQGATFQR